MNANIVGCLNNINRSYKLFEYKNKQMSKEQVIKLLNNSLKKGYESTSQITDEDIEEVINIKV